MPMYMIKLAFVSYTVCVRYDVTTERSAYKCFSASTSKRPLRSHAGNKQDVDDDEEPNPNKPVLVEGRL